MKKIKDFIDEQKNLILVTTIIIVGFYLFYKFIIKKPFLLSNDQWFQYNEFYKEWIRLITSFIKGEGKPFYSWNMYLGTDFYSSMVYYCTGDLFLPILLFFRNNIEIGLIVETILCVYLSGVSMNVFLKEYGINSDKIRLFISLIYAFGAESMIYFGVYMFHRFYAFLPLLFLGVLYYFNYGKKRFFIIISAILFLQNFYFMYPTLIFLFGFCLLEECNKKRNYKEIIKDFFSLLFSLIAGFMLSSFVTLPGVLSLVNNPRIGEVTSDNIRWGRNVYYGLLMSLTSLNPVDIEGNIFYTTHEVHDNYYNLLIGIIPLVSYVDYIFNKKHINELMFGVVLLIIALVRPLNSIMHGFSEPSLRWLFLFEFYILIIAAKGMMNVNNRKLVIIALIYFSIFLYFIYEGFKKFWINPDLNAMHLQIIVVSSVINLTILVLYLFNKKMSAIINILFIITSLAYYQFLQTKNSYVAESPIYASEVNYFASIDDDNAYRYFIDYRNNNPNSFLNKNKSLSYGFMTTSTYSSTFDANINLFNRMSGAIVGLDWMLDVRDPYLNTALGNKYYIVYKDDELPSELEFEYAYNFNHLKVYKNLMFQGFGYCASNLDYTYNYSSSIDMLSTVYIDNQDIDIDQYGNLEYAKLIVEEKTSDSFKAEISLKQDNILFIPIPNNSGWNIYVNKEIVKPISVNGGFIGLQLSAGLNEIEMNFIPNGFKIGIVLTCIGMLYLLVLTKIDKHSV